jgi:LysM repeat protein
MSYAYLPPARTTLAVVAVASVLGFVAACSTTSEHTAPQASAAVLPGSGSALPFAAANPATNNPAPSAATAMRTTAMPVGQVATPGPLLNPRHPERYVVQPGDTLWDIAAMFLRDPWYWPEIWQINPQVENPHLIYPGDVLALAFLNNGQPVIQLERGSALRLSPQVRAQPLEQAIPTIPYETLRAFLSRPTVLDRDQIEELPYIFAHQEGLIASAGRDVYARGVDAAPGHVYSVIHLGEPLVDPDDDDVIGYEGIYVGQGEISRGGDPLTVHLTDTNREALVGDYLLEEQDVTPANFLPRAPETDIDGRIISVIDGVSLIGQYQVVVVNRGARDGLEAGHVLKVWQTGQTVTDEIGKRGLLGEKVRLPDLPAGTMLLFRIYDRMSYGLVMEATSEIRVLDTVRNL